MPSPADDVFYRETLKSLERGVRGVIQLGTNTNRLLRDIVDVVKIQQDLNRSQVSATRDLITEMSALREQIRIDREMRQKSAEFEEQAFAKAAKRQG